MVNTRRSFSSIARHLPHSQQFGTEGSSKATLQCTYKAPPTLPRRFGDTLLEFLHPTLYMGPVDLVPLQIVGWCMYCHKYAQLFHDTTSWVRSGVLAIKDLLDVCPPFGIEGNVAQRRSLYPRYYYAAFAFSSILCPACDRRTLRFGFHLSVAQSGVAQFRTVATTRVGATFAPRVRHPRFSQYWKEKLDPIPFWSEPISPFGSLGLTKPQTVVHICSPYWSGQAPSPHLGLQSSPTSRENGAGIARGTHVPAARHPSLLKRTCR